MMDHEERLKEEGGVLLGALELAEAKRIQARLEEEDQVHLVLRSNPDSCGPGGKCKPTVEVWAHQEDLLKIQAFFSRERMRDFGDLEVNPDLHAEVFDTEKATARCPACGTEFSTQLRECPDCGLVFVSE